MHHNMMEKMENLYHELKLERSDIDHDLIMHLKEHYPKKFKALLCEWKYGSHISTEEMYQEAVKHFVNKDGSHGAHWSVDAVADRSGLDFHHVPYTKYDFAYAVNMFYSDYGNIISDTSSYLKMAKCYLTDEDYPGDPSERSYHNAKKRTDYYSH